MGFIGSYAAKVDSKGRLRIPSGLLDQVKEGDADCQFVVKKGVAGTLFLYTVNSWNEMIAELDQGLDPFDPEDIRFKGAFLRGHVGLVPDSNSRVKIPENLMEFARIKSSITFESGGNYFKLMSTEKYDSLGDVSPDEYDEIMMASVEKRKRNRNGGG